MTNPVSAVRAPETSRISVRVFALAVPLVLVNAVAVYGQVMWAQDHITSGLPHPLACALVFAAALESVGVYLAYEAHAALMAGDASGKLRLASYGVALVVGSLNYAHYAANLRPTAPAFAFGLLSTISPWLWSIRSRSNRRTQLREAGLVDGRAAHFSTARWIHFPVRTLRAFRRSVWTGNPDPAAAISDTIPGRSEVQTPDAFPPASGWVSAPSGIATLPIVSPETRNSGRALHSVPTTLPGVPNPAYLRSLTDQEVIGLAETTVRMAREAGIMITGAILGEAYGRSDSWGRARIRAVA